MAFYCPQNKMQTFPTVCKVLPTFAGCSTCISDASLLGSFNSSPTGLWPIPSQANTSPTLMAWQLLDSLPMPFSLTDLSHYSNHSSDVTSSKRPFSEHPIYCVSFCTPLSSHFLSHCPAYFFSSLK